MVPGEAIGKNTISKDHEFVPICVDKVTWGSSTSNVELSPGTQQGTCHAILGGVPLYIAFWQAEGNTTTRI